MFWGISVLVLFLLFVTAKGELPTYIGFFTPQPNTSDTSAGATAISTAAGQTVPLMPGVPAAVGAPSQNTIPWTTVPGSLIGG